MFIVDDIINAIGSQQAALAQEQAAKAAQDFQKQIYAQQRADQAPWLQAGQQSLASLMDLTRAGPQTLSPDQIANDPGYQFQLQQGQQALQRSAAAKGLLNSGATLKGLDRYSQGLAATQYQNAWDRNQALYANKWNRLGQLSGVGQSSAQNLGGIGTSYANAMSELYGAQGNAQAAGILGMTGGMASATRSAGNMMTMGLGGMMGGGGGMGGMLSGLMGGGK